MKNKGICSVTVTKKNITIVKINCYLKSTPGSISASQMPVEV